MVKKFLTHLIDSTALVTATNPIYCGFEVTIGNLSDIASKHARLFFSSLNYLGLGYIYSQGRDYSREKFNIKDNELKQNLHDIFYSFSFSLIIAPPIYSLSQLSAGETIDLLSLTKSTLMASGISAALGSPLGYAIDIFRDLTGIEECSRSFYPKFIKKQKSYVKKAICAGLIGLSIGAMGIIYSLTPDKQLTDNNPIHGLCQNYEAGSIDDTF
ncbi:hypothetical protein ACFL1H_06545 [Nanoarchaeota archaeon]